MSSSSPTSPTLPPCPFVAGSRITDLRLFVGRKDELHEITTHMTGVQPTSLNIVGERRIGKSSLLYHFFQTWEQRVQDTNRYVVIYLSLQEASCRNKSGFYQAVVQEFSSRPYVQSHTTLASALVMSSFDDAMFARALRQWKQNDVLPVICLDEFEVFLQHKDEFDDTFYNHLRSLMDSNVLMLVIASYRPLDVYGATHLLTSRFFNVGHLLYLGDFTDDEAAELVCLPASTLPGTQAALSTDEQQHAREWAGGHPYRLQLAGSFLCQARQQGKSVAWAKGRFEAEAQRLVELPLSVPNMWPPLRLLVWSLPLRIGSLSKYIGAHSGDYKVWITGVVILAVAFALIILIALHLTTIAQVIGAWLKAALGG